MRTLLVFGSLALLTIFYADPSRAANATLWVANDGADTGSCGTQTSPCRSISQAIENASDGDTIEVGEGRYGNITGTGTFTGGGDEHGQLLPRGVGCIVCITKALHIFSLHGAAVTMIQGLAGSQFNSTVVIGHDGVTFGSQDHGFTLTGGNATGLTVVLNTVNDFNSISIVAPIRIGGNIDAGDATGFAYAGPNFVDMFCYGCVFTGQVLISNNEADNNSQVGFDIVLGERDNEPIVLQSNVARSGGTGFGVFPGIASETGDTLRGSQNVSFVNNVAIGNAVGFNANSPGDIRGNTSSGNSQFGFYVIPGGGAFAGNTVIGNGGPGIIVQYSADGQSPDIAELGLSAIPHFSSFTGNDFFGNDRNRPLLQLGVYAPVGPNPTYNPGPSAHCGVLNVGALTGPVQGVLGPAITLKATGNFWGSAKGPSTSGPGDEAGGACDQNNATTVFKPFAAAFL